MLPGVPGHWQRPAMTRLNNKRRSDGLINIFEEDTNKQYKGVWHGMKTRTKITLRKRRLIKFQCRVIR
jgi:hypothetical protein